MERGGNKRVNVIFEATLSESGGEERRPPIRADLPTREAFIREKYEHRQFYDDSKAATVFLAETISSNGDIGEDLFAAIRPSPASIAETELLQSVHGASAPSNPPGEQKNRTRSSSDDGSMDTSSHSISSGMRPPISGKRSKDEQQTSGRRAGLRHHRSHSPPPPPSSKRAEDPLATRSEHTPRGPPPTAPSSLKRGDGDPLRTRSEHGRRFRKASSCRHLVRSASMD